MFFNKKIFKNKTGWVKNTAVNHWLVQKISAFVLFPLLCWFLFVLKDFLYRDYASKILWLKDYTNSILLTLFLLVALFHLRLGLIVVIDDYIHNLKGKNFLLSSVAILCLLLAVFTVLVILVLSIGKDV